MDRTKVILLLEEAERRRNADDPPRVEGLAEKIREARMHADTGRYEASGRWKPLKFSPFASRWERELADRINAARERCRGHNQDNEEAH